MPVTKNIYSFEYLVGDSPTEVVFKDERIGMVGEVYKCLIENKFSLFIHIRPHTELVKRLKRYYDDGARIEIDINSRVNYIKRWIIKYDNNKIILESFLPYPIDFDKTRKTVDYPELMYLGNVEKVSISDEYTFNIEYIIQNEQRIVVFANISDSIMQDIDRLGDKVAEFNANKELPVFIGQDIGDLDNPDLLWVASINYIGKEIVFAATRLLSPIYEGVEEAPLGKIYYIDEFDEYKIKMLPNDVSIIQRKDDKLNYIINVSLRGRSKLDYSNYIQNFSSGSSFKFLFKYHPELNDIEWKYLTNYLGLNVSRIVFISEDIESDFELIDHEESKYIIAQSNPYYTISIAFYNLAILEIGNNTIKVYPISGLDQGVYDYLKMITSNLNNTPIKLRSVNDTYNNTEWDVEDINEDYEYILLKKHV